MATKHRLRHFLLEKASRVCRPLIRHDPTQSLVLFTEPRGGGTWLTELISEIPGSAVLWEPLHLRHAPAFQALGFSWRQYIPENTLWPDARLIFEQTFQGRLLNAWNCGISSPWKFIIANELIVKFSRANAMLPWLTREFEFRRPPVYLVRHPFAVAASQLHHPAWRKHIVPLDVKERFPGLRDLHADFLSTLKKPEEILVAQWCLTNSIPLRHPENNKRWVTVHYERLMQQPETELRRIFDRWSLPLPPSSLDIIRKPSVTTVGPSDSNNIERQLSRWKSFFTSRQIASLMGILEHFEITSYGRDIDVIQHR